MSRSVRTTVEFWESLDYALPSGSVPSWHDFAAIDLPVIVERIGQRWDEELPLIPGRTDYRQIIGAGEFCIYAVDAQLAPDGAVELINITVDTTGLPPANADKS